LTFVAQFVAVTKICPQPRQNAATTDMASNDADDDVILIAGVLIICQVLLLVSVKTANKSKRSIWTHRWIEQREKYGAYHGLVTKRKVNKQKLTNSAQSFLQLVEQFRAGWYSDLSCASYSATADDRRATKVPQQGCATKVCNRSLRVSSGLPVCLPCDTLFSYGDPIRSVGPHSASVEPHCVDVMHIQDPVRLVCECCYIGDSKV